MKPDRPSKNLMTTLPRTASQTTTSARCFGQVLALDVALEVQVGRVEQLGRALDTGVALALLLADRQERDAGVRDARARAPRRSPPCGRTGRGSPASSRGWRRCRAAPSGPLPVIIWTASAGRSTPGSRPRRRTAAAIPAPVWPAVTTASAWPVRTRSVATRIEASFFSRSARAGCSSMPMTWLACTMRDVGRQRSCASRSMTARRRRGSADRRDARGRSRGCRGTTSAAPWSPPIASTARRTPPAAASVGTGRGSVTGQRAASSPPLPAGFGWIARRPW